MQFQALQLQAQPSEWQAFWKTVYPNVAEFLTKTRKKMSISILTGLLMNVNTVSFKFNTRH